MISLARAGGMRLPQFDERLRIEDDGTFSMWRSVSSASDPPAPIGKFAGQLSDAQRESIETAAQAVIAEGSRDWLISPDSPVDHIEVDGVASTLGIHDRGEGAWTPLIERLRTLLHDLTESPQAAIALEVDNRARLVHRGTESLDLDLSHLTLRADQRRDGHSEGHWSAPAMDKGAVAAGPGWQLELPFDHGFNIQADDRIVAYATFAATNGDDVIQVSLQTL